MFDVVIQNLILRSSLVYYSSDGFVIGKNMRQVLSLMSISDTTSIHSDVARDGTLILAMLWPKQRCCDRWQT